MSPDARLIAAYWWDERADSPTKIALIPFARGKPVSMFDFTHGAYTDPVVRWTRDGKGLSYVRNHSGGSDIYVHPLNGDEPEPLTGTASDLIFSFDWSPDGRRLVCSRGVLTDQVVLMRNFR